MSAPHPQGKVPVTMLSGFLGAGKTTLLRYLLENSKVKIACVVNDVASINIDAKLVRNDRNRNTKGDSALSSTKDLADTVELQNGCACCNLQDELFASFEQILTMADQRGEPYARIVLENSGVAEPSNIRDKFKEAAEAGNPLLERIYLDTLVTVVDASTFGKDFASRQPLAARPDLGDGGNLRPVVDLLVEQVEVADFVVLNKTDLIPAAAGQEQAAATSQALEELLAIVSSLNPMARVIPCSQGQVPLDTVFGVDAHAVMSNLNIEGLHRGAVAAARSMEAAGKEQQEGKEHHHHHHHHHHEHNHADHAHHDDCTACKHEDHEHNHTDHAHHDDCTACKHEDGVKQEHNHADHAHHDDCAACKHEDGHAHHHHHHHHHHHKQQAATTAATRFGIKSFVYCRRRPFHPQRLKEMVLKWLPVAKNTAIDNEAPQLGDSPIKAVLRSKGFMWMSNSHTTAYYWSHAGQHFEIRDEGDWWCAVPDEDWPEAGSGRDAILADWDLQGEWGDRRQEIVFIGVAMDQAKICDQLDSALLTDEELAKYKERWAGLADPTHAAVEAVRHTAKKVKLEEPAPPHHH